MILDYLDEETHKSIEQYISLYKVSRKQAIKDAFSNVRTYPELEKLSFVQGNNAPKFRDYVVDVLLQWTEKCASIYGPVITKNYCETHRKQRIIAKLDNLYYLTCCDEQGGQKKHIPTCEICNEDMKLEVKTKTIKCDSCKFSMKYEPELSLMEWRFETKYSDEINEQVEDVVTKLIEVNTGNVQFTFVNQYRHKKYILSQRERELMERIERDNQRFYHKYLGSN